MGSLLFVAHREEILRQSLSVFRQVMRDGAFGELRRRPRGCPRVGDTYSRPSSRWHAPTSPNSTPVAFDMVVVNEFHHAEAPDLHPAPRPSSGHRVLLGSDRDSGAGRRPRRRTSWFGGRIASELRLWEALERQLLVPFSLFRHPRSGEPGGAGGCVGAEAAGEDTTTAT